MNPNACPDCDHEAVHTTLVGCLHPDCECQSITSRTPEQMVREARAEGVKGQEAALASHAMTVSPEGREWKAKAEERLDQLIKSGEPFTANDVTAVVGVAPSPSAIGGLFRGRKKDMKSLGYDDQNGRAVAHGRPLRIWQGVTS